MSRSETISVSVENQILWVDSEAYPVRNIARAQTVQFKPRWAQGVFRFLFFTLLWVFVGVVAISLFRSSDVPAGAVLVVVGFLVLLHFVAMVRTLLTPTLYALIIETSGTPHTALVNRDRAQISRLVHNIMDAINDPRATFGPIMIENFHHGDKNLQINGGKVGVIGDHGRLGSLN